MKDKLLEALFSSIIYLVIFGWWWLLITYNSTIKCEEFNTTQEINQRLDELTQQNQYISDLLNNK